MGEAADSMQAFHPAVRRWFAARYGAPTGVQRLVWPRVAEGAHVLATAPTGSGKTLAAFLWAINQLGTGAWEAGRVRVLYVSPLRALNNDIGRNLLGPLRELREQCETEGEQFADVRVMVRSGDTEPSERRRQAKKPAEILVTTPESLNLLLSSAGGRSILSGVRTVILDEVHAIADSKRGTYLMTAVERLTRLSGEFQRIALSATVEPLELIARFVGGYQREDGQAVPRPVLTLRSPDTKAVELRVRPIPEKRHGENSVWPPVAEELRQQLRDKASTLVFVNNRRLSERLTHLINESAGRTEAYSHHGSLARELRALVEDRLKRGELKAIVATSSLELGIDVGAVEQVLLVQSPRTLNGAIQRVGRAGHSVGAVSRATLYPSHGSDLIDAAVLAPLIRAQKPQPVKPVANALDVLAQVIVSMCGVEAWDQEQLLDFLRTSWPYHALSREAFALVVQMLSGRYGDARIGVLRPRLMRDDDGKLRSTEGALGIVYTSGGVIPDRGYFSARIRGARGVLGQLDEEFVWERKVGDRFRIGMQTWRIEKITHNDVEVTPAGSGAGAIVPFWRNEAEERSFDMCERIGLFMEWAEENLRRPEFADALVDERGLDEDAAQQLSEFLHRQRGATGTPLPHRHHLLVEHLAEGRPQKSGGAESRAGVQVIVHACWGGSVLRPWAVALAAAWEKRFGTTIEVFNTDECLLLQLPQDKPATELIELVPPEDLEALLRKRLEASGFFAARFRENAARALLLPRQLHRRMPLWLNRLRARKLFKAVRRYRDFPIVAETWRQCLEDLFELDRLRQLLEELRVGAIRVSEARTLAPSPLAASLIWRSTNEYMYQRDGAAGEGEGEASNLSDEALRAVLRDAALRPRLPEALVRDLVSRLRRTWQGYAPTTADELADLVNERLIVPWSQWEELAAAVRRDVPDGAAVITAAAEKLLTVRLPGAADRAVIEQARLPRVLAMGQWEAGQCDVRPMDAAAASAAPAPAPFRPKEEDEDLAVEAVAVALAFSGPLSLEALAAWLGLDGDRLETALAQLVDEGRVVADALREASDAVEYCDAENLERLLRMLRRAARVEVEPRPGEELALLMATLQGVTSAGTSMEDLQERMEKLFGYAAPAALWESAILPARMKPYVPHLLDALVQQSDLLWLGAGREQVLFAFRGDLSLYVTVPRRASAVLPPGHGRWDFFEIERHAGITSGRLTTALWQETWDGLITNDSFATLRKGVANRFEASELLDAGDRGTRRMRGAFRAWQSTRPLAGNWYAVRPAPEEPDRLEALEADKERVRQLLARCGVLFRDLLAREQPLLRWGKLLPALRLMELSGEVLVGHFFSGIPGLQFASPEALRAMQRLQHDTVYWLSAADPASPCGLKIQGTDYPPRQVGTIVVFHGPRLAMVVRRQGKDLQIRVRPGDPNLGRYLDCLREQMTREVLPWRRVTVETINDQPATKSEYTEVLRAFGFERDYAGLVLYRTF